MNPLYNCLLVSTYELGHQPFGLAEPAAVLRQIGAVVETLDLAVEGLDEAAFRRADLIAFYVPMHTATRLAAQTAGPTAPRLNSLDRAPSARRTAQRVLLCVTETRQRREPISSLPN